MIRPLFLGSRHGTTNDNLSNEYRGWSTGPDAHLNETGRSIIRKNAMTVKRMGFTFPLIITDSLPRTLESAKIYQEILEIPELEIDDRARTVNVGDLTGKSKTDNPLTQYFQHPNKRIPGGETVNEFRHRQAELYADIMGLVEQFKQPVFVLFHGANISYLYNHFNNPANPVMYEGIVNTGGVVMFYTGGIVPITELRGKDPSFSAALNFLMPEILPSLVKV